MNKPINICFWGIFSPAYCRNYMFIEGLKKLGFKVYLCNYDLNSLSEYKKINSKILIFANLAYMFIIRFFIYLFLAFKFAIFCRDCDVIITGCEYHEDIIWTKFLAHIFNKKLIFNALNSNYETSVIDRRAIRNNSLYAKYIFMIDKLSFNLPNVIIVDTNQHKEYFSEIFNSDKNKFKVIYVGADENIFSVNHNRRADKDTITAIFYGTYTPLHGIDYIIKAAEILKNEKVKFILIGDGQLKEKIVKMAEKIKLDNVDFIPEADNNNLIQHLIKCDIGLGIFGETEKAKRVIPHKVFQMMMAGLPVITGESLASKEIFVNNKHCVFTNMADAQDLAQKIMLLKNDKNLRNKIAENGKELVLKEYNTQKIAEEIYAVLK